MKRVAILGSTGSIGRSALSVIENFSKDFSVVALSAGSNVEILEAQIRKFKPKYAVCADEDSNSKLKKIISGNTEILSPKDGIEGIASLGEVDLVLIAISGFNALHPLLAAIRAGKEIALANKEALVSAGALIDKELKKHKSFLLPIDSEQCAIFQCLGNVKDDKLIKTIYLTASGGSLYFSKIKDFRSVTKERVLDHPRWSMGKKITVDSATLMNKALEIIEARWLFGIDVGRIKVLIHPQAAVHSMVEFIDGSILAQLSITDMRLPIQFALTFPKRLKTPFPSLDLVGLKDLSFLEPDIKRFRSLPLAYSVAKMKSSAATVLNAANEEAVRAFLKDELRFSDIIKVIESVLEKHKAFDLDSLQDVLRTDSWAREIAQEIIKRKN